MKKEFIKELNKSPPTEVFIDTIKGRHPADEIIPVNGRWNWDSKHKYHYAGGLPFLNATAKLLFKHHKDKPYDGNVLCEFSAPKVLYDNNVCGVFYKDRNTLFYEPKELMTDYCINVDLARNPVDFSTFDVTRIDLSFCFFPKDDDEQQEFLRLFRNMYFENLIPGKSCSKEYDYENGFAHTSPKLDIVLYDKAIQLRVENPKIHIEDIKLLRLEFRCKKPYKSDNAGSDFFESFDNTIDRANKWLAKKLEKNNFTLPVVPKKEYMHIITKCYEAKRNEYEGRPAKEKPLYLRHKLESLLKKLKQINKDGCYAFHSSSETNRCWYSRCLKLVQDAGVHILYTKLNHEISFIDDVCYHQDLYRVFGATSYEPVAVKATEEAAHKSKSVDLFSSNDKPLFVEAAKIYNIRCSFEQSLSKKISSAVEIISNYLCSDDRLNGYSCFKPIVKFSSSSVADAINNVCYKHKPFKRVLRLCSDDRFINYVSAPLKAPLYHRLI